MARSNRNVNTIKTVLNKIFLTDSFQWALKKYRVIDKWKEVVGKNIYKHTDPIDYRQAKLIVYVDDPVWMNELNLQKLEIIEKFNRKFRINYIKDIYFKIGRIEHKHDQEEIEQTGSRVDLSDIKVPQDYPLPEIDVKDEEMKNEFEKLILLSIKRKIYDDIHKSDEKVIKVQKKKADEKINESYGIRTNFFSTDD